MLNLWPSLNWPQALVLAFALAAFCAGALPVIAECVTHLIEYVLAFLMCVVAAAWPSFARHSPALIQALDTQRRDRRKAASKKPIRPSEEAAA